MSRIPSIGNGKVYLPGSEVTNSWDCELSYPPNAATKRYDDDPAKALSRQALKCNIEKQLLPFYAASDLKVLCFPGINSREIIEVYDALGLKHENIFGAEIDPNIAAVIHKTAPDINLVPYDVGDFLKEHRELKFHVVSFDYTSPINREQLKLISFLRMHMAGDRMLYHQANLAKRDAASDPIYRAFYFSNPVPLIKAQISGDNTAYGKALASNRDEFNRERRAGPYKKSRTLAHRAAILNLLVEGCFPQDHLAMFNHLLGPKRMSKVISKFIPQLSAMWDDFHGNPISGEYLPCSQTQILWDKAFDVTLQKRLRSAGLFLPELQAFIEQAFRIAKRGRSFIIAEHGESYSYISESAAPMIGQIITVKRAPAIVTRAEGLIRHVHYSKDIRASRTFARDLDNYTKTFLSEIRSDYSDPVYFGSSAKPVLTKALAIQCFKDGMSVDEVKKQFRGWKKKPLAQWKAHVTMGTYDVD